MKKYLLAVSIIIALPFFSFAAYNDVTLTTATILSVGGFTLNVSGASSAVESITVGASSFSAVLQPGSIISVSSASGKVLSTNAPAVNISGNECTAAGKSILTLAVPSDATASVTVSVTPTSSTCSGSATSATTGGGAGNGAPGGGGGGGGGGGSVITPTKPAVPATPAVPAVAKAVPATPAVPAAVFKKPLSVGITSSDVLQLQQLLNADSDTRVAVSGAGSPGNETNYFGPATKRAVEKFQKKYGIATSGQPGFGSFGPKTRAKLNQLAASGLLSSGKLVVPQSTVSPSSTAAIQKQLSDSLILLQSLQAQLKVLQGGN